MLKIHAHLSLFTILLAITVGTMGCSDTQTGATTSTEKALLGKWRASDRRTLATCEFRRGELTYTNFAGYTGGDLPGHHGTIVRYSIPEENVFQILRDGEKLNHQVRFLSDRLIEITDPRSTRTLYLRWSDHSKAAIQGVYYSNKDRYEKALPFLTAAAEGGEPDAQYYLARQYFQGKGVNANNEAALKWAKASVEGDFPWVYGLLGNIHVACTVPPDYENAIATFETAKTRGVLKGWDKAKLLWMYAAAPDPYCNGEKAAAMAAVAPKEDYLFRSRTDETRALAAAYAAGGDFETAKKLQRTLLKKLRNATTPRLVKMRKEAIRVMDTLYTRGKPFCDAKGEIIAEMVEYERVN